MLDRDIEDTRQPKEPLIWAECDRCGTKDDITDMYGLDEYRFLCYDCMKELLHDRKSANKSDFGDLLDD